jgi:hypothetical protein
MKAGELFIEQSVNEEAEEEEGDISRENGSDRKTSFPHSKSNCVGMDWGESNANVAVGSGSDDSGWPLNSKELRGIDCSVGWL